VAIGAFAFAIVLGYAALKARPRSYALLVASATTLLASLAMVTVTLVATDEHPSPPDGALLVPYVVPVALVALGLGVGGRGAVLFRRGGVGRRLLSPAVAAVGGAIAFAAFELSRLASLF
jgi:peptidoglycan/LPS O-acetylase OafA/YrhL